MSYRKIGITCLTSAALAMGCAPPEASETAPTADAETVSEQSQALFGSDTCRDVEIIVTNNRSNTIEVRWVEYYSASEGRWNREDLGNREIGSSNWEWWWNEDLGSAENDLITQWKISFRERIGLGWTAWTEQTDNTSDLTCIASRDFYMAVD